MWSGADSSLFVHMLSANVAHTERAPTNIAASLENRRTATPHPCSLETVSRPVQHQGIATIEADPRANTVAWPPRGDTTNHTRKKTETSGGHENNNKRDTCTHKRESTNDCTTVRIVEGLPCPSPLLSQAYNSAACMAVRRTRRPSYVGCVLQQ